jgi:ribosomal-protein-alanine acetyltransferase
MTSEVRVRRMREADLDQVLEIAAGLKDAPHWPRAAYEYALGRDSTPRRIALVAKEPGTGGVIGFAVAALIAPQAEVETIAVSVAEQRRGIGKMLLCGMAEELRAAGADEVLLEVRASNEGAREFYSSQGWCESGRRPRYYADPEEDAVLMSLRLG